MILQQARTITLHTPDNKPIEVRIGDIDKLVPVNKHANFPEIKTQVILKPWSSSDNNWLYVIELPEEIERLVDKTRNT